VAPCDKDIIVFLVVGDSAVLEDRKSKLEVLEEPSEAAFVNLSSNLA
jgi:hypothetical protein